MKKLKWIEFKSNKIRTFRLEEEPEIIYLIKIRDNEYMIVHEDGYDMNTGTVNFVNNKEIKDKYNIDIN